MILLSEKTTAELTAELQAIDQRIERLVTKGRLEGIGQETEKGLRARRGILLAEIDRRSKPGV